MPPRQGSQPLESAIAGQSSPDQDQSDHELSKDESLLK
jgi:hypothetical protein